MIRAVRSNPYEEYAAAMAAEKAAWDAVKDCLPGVSGFRPELWEAWRASVHRADAARRAMMQAAPSFGARVRSDGPHTRNWASARSPRPPRKN